MRQHPTAFGFSGHETFPFRYAWLKKGLDAATDDGTVFLRDDALTTLGVGKNMVRPIRHWSLVDSRSPCGARGYSKPHPVGPPAACLKTRYASRRVFSGIALGLRDRPEPC
jgi:hypothetical protein